MKYNGTSKLRRWKARRWYQDPHCFWCGTVTILFWERPENWRNLRRGDSRRRIPRNLATVDHLRDRYDPTRTEPAKNNEARRVLSCWSCNNYRSHLRTKAQPIEELWKRARHYERMMNKLRIKEEGEKGQTAQTEV